MTTFGQLLVLFGDKQDKQDKRARIAPVGRWHPVASGGPDGGPADVFFGGFHGHLRSSEDLEAHRLEALGDRGLRFERSRSCVWCNLWV